MEQIKSKLSILDVVSPYVKLVKAGKYWRGLSPFNKEKTPSFYVNIDRGSYYCFSSSQGGDMFDFVQKMEGVDFKGALKILAEKAGVPLQFTRAGGESKEKKERLRDVMARSELFYQGLLKENKAVQEYAKGRGLSQETVSAWGIGYAPDAWRDLYEHLRSSGFTDKELIDAGVIKESEGKRGSYYDRFRQRLMFPIKDMAGRTVAFTGRALPGGKAGKEDAAKYLNSPETDLYKKHEILFGMDKAKDAIRTRGFTILVEGQMDLLLLHQIGFTNTVALSGTALSKEHLALMKRYSDNLMFALDNDRAGLAATQKNALVALSNGMKVKAVVMPQGKDPADIAHEDAKDMTKRIAEAQPIVEFFLRVITTSKADEHARVLAVERIVMPLLRSIESPMEREHFVGVVARGTGSTIEAVRGSLTQYEKKQDSDRLHSAGDTMQTKEVPASLSQREHRTKLLHAIVTVYEGSELAQYVSSEYSRINGTSLPDTPPDERWLFEVGLAFGESPTRDSADELLRAFEKIVLSEQLAIATSRLRLAEVRDKKADIDQEMKECTRLSSLLRTLG